MAGHMSLFLGDLNADAADIDYERWHDPEIKRLRVLPSENDLQITTARIDIVDVRLRTWSGVPETLAASHVVEVDLDVPTGELALIADDGLAEEFRKSVQPGRHRVRVSYVPTADGPPESDDDEPGDHYLYVIDVWRTPKAAPPSVLVEGPAAWAY